MISHIGSARRRRRFAIKMLAMAMAMALAATPAAWAQIAGEKEIRARIEQRYDLTVLALSKAPGPESDRVLAKVMNPPGDSNSALQVYTILVDAMTGERLQNP